MMMPKPGSLLIKISVLGLMHLVVFYVALAQKSSEEKPTAESIVSKHLLSIGAAADRKAIKTITAIGLSKATFLGRGGGVAEGVSVLASTDSKYMIGMKFNTSDYPLDTMGYDGKEFTVGYVKPGVRSTLGSFLQTNESTFKLGILSGALSRNWTLLDGYPADAKIKYAGLKKINNQKLHALDYNPKKGSDLSITLYFDPDTFRHVRTEYKRVIAARLGAGGVDSSARQSETRYRFVEEFGDFSTENNLTLPHSYKMFLEILSGNGTISYEWLLTLQKFSFNQTLEDRDFKVDSY